MYEAPDVNLFEAEGTDFHGVWPDAWGVYGHTVFDVDVDMCGHCDVDGCCVNEDWAAAVLPSMALLDEDGVVHITRPGEPVSFCLSDGDWPVPCLQSTDEALAFARSRRVDLHIATCLFCIRVAFFYDEQS